MPWFLQSVTLVPSCLIPACTVKWYNLHTTLHFRKGFKYCGWVFIVVAVFFLKRNILALFFNKNFLEWKNYIPRTKITLKTKVSKPVSLKKQRIFHSIAFGLLLLRECEFWFRTVPSHCPFHCWWLRHAWNFSWIEEMDPQSNRLNVEVQRVIFFWNY